MIFPPSTSFFKVSTKKKLFSERMIYALIRKVIYLRLKKKEKSKRCVYCTKNYVVPHSCPSKQSIMTLAKKYL